MKQDGGGNVTRNPTCDVINIAGCVILVDARQVVAVILQSEEAMRAARVTPRCRVTIAFPWKSCLGCPSLRSQQGDTLIAGYLMCTCAPLCPFLSRRCAGRGGSDQTFTFNGGSQTTQFGCSDFQALDMSVSKSESEHFGTTEPVALWQCSVKPKST